MPTGEAEGEQVQAPLLQPLLGLIHYASFAAHLRILLSSLVHQHSSLQLHMDAFQRLGGMAAWQPGGTVAAILINAFIGTGLAVGLLVFYRSALLRDAQAVAVESL